MRTREAAAVVAAGGELDVVAKTSDPVAVFVAVCEAMVARHCQLPGRAAAAVVAVREAVVADEAGRAAVGTAATERLVGAAVDSTGFPSASGEPIAEPLLPNRTGLQYTQQCYKY